jgi:hypothetical protein
MHRDQISKYNPDASVPIARVHNADVRATRLKRAMQSIPLNQTSTDQTPTKSHVLRLMSHVSYLTSHVSCFSSLV